MGTLRWRPWVTWVVFALLDLVCVGAGMGVPILAIVFGFAVGWYIARRALAAAVPAGRVLRRVLLYAMLTSAFTFLVMLLLWAPTARLLFDPRADLANFGIPMILYEPRWSFIGWLVLMVFISPFLQLLTTIFAAYVTMLAAWAQPGSSSSPST